MGRTVYQGDSLGVGTTRYMKGVDADVKVGRTSAEGVRGLKRQLAKGGVSKVVADLGTNDGSARELASSVRKIRKLAKGKPVYLATVRGPQAKQKNAYLKREAAKGNINLIDASKTGGVAGDGIHLTAAGYKKRARLVQRSLKGGGSPQRASRASSAPVDRGALRSYLASRRPSSPVSDIRPYRLPPTST
jgi:hypothetical protein